MSIPSIKELVGGDAKVHFLRYQQGELWYRCDQGFNFPVPVSDTGDGAFLAEDRAIYFMRWIRRHLEFMRSPTDPHSSEAPCGLCAGRGRVDRYDGVGGRWDEVCTQCGGSRIVIIKVD